MRATPAGQRGVIGGADPPEAKTNLLFRVIRAIRNTGPEAQPKITAATPASIDHASEQLDGERHPLTSTPTDNRAGMLDAGLRCGWTLLLITVPPAPDLDYEGREELCLRPISGPRRQLLPLVVDHGSTGTPAHPRNGRHAAAATG